MQKRRFGRISWSLIVVVLLGTAAVGQQPRLYLGALEDIPPATQEDGYHFAVRAAFYKDGADWKPLPLCDDDDPCLKTIGSKYPASVNWTVGFDGRALAKLSARTPAGYGKFAQVGLEEVTQGAAPTVGKRSLDFAGWMETPVYRALVASSHADFDDPEHWKPAELPAKFLPAIRRDFRAKYPKVENCINSDGEDPKPWPYKDEYVRAVKAYGSNRGWYVARVELEANHCEGPPDDPFVDQWYAVAPDGLVQFLDAGMWLVDAGDYDHDGRSELVFSIAREDRGGYELFYADFARKAVFEYNFH